MDIDLVNEEG